MVNKVPIRDLKGEEIFLPYSPARWSSNPTIEPCLVIYFKDSGSLADPTRLIVKWRKMESIKSNSLQTFIDIRNNEKMLINTNLIVKVIERNFVTLEIWSDNKYYGLGTRKMHICIDKEQNEVKLKPHYRNLDQYTKNL